MILYQRGKRAFFVYGFAKSERSNVRPDEIATLKELASELSAYDDGAIARAVASGALIEVKCDEQDQIIKSRKIP
jgi:hypothetical protein